MTDEDEGREYLETGAGAPPTEQEAEFLAGQDLPTAKIGDDDDEALAKSVRDYLEAEAEDSDGIEDVDLTNCNVSFLINVRNVKSLGEALDIAAVNLGRYGMDAFYVLATDPDTGRQWIISNGEILPAEDVVAELDQLKEELGD